MHVSQYHLLINPELWASHFVFLCHILRNSSQLNFFTK